MSENFYAILEIEPGVEQEVIDSAYRRLALLYHPDLNHSPEATRRMQEVNVAYTTLRNPSKRALYDRSNGISTVIHSSGPTSFTNREAYRQQNVYNPPPRAATPPPPPPPPVTNSAPPSETQLLTFYIENSAYAFNILDIESVNMMQPLMQHLRAPLFVEGLIAYRGGRIPVVDLRRHLGFPNQPATRETRILVVKFSSISTGLIVDSTGSPLRVENSSIESPQTASDGVRPSFVKGTVRSGYQVVVILDLAALFTLEEYRALKNFMAV